MPGVARCSAVFIEPHWAVTAAHCLGQRVLGHVAPASAVHVLPGYRDGEFARHLQPDVLYVDPAATNDLERHRGSDLALLHFGAATAEFVSLETGTMAPGTALSLAGYGQDRAERLLVDGACSARGMSADADGAPLLVHDCNGTRGTSGGALLERLEDGWRLAGVQVAGNLAGAGGLAVPGREVARLLQEVR